MKIVFCEDPLDNHHPDAMYQPEADAARSAGFEFELINYEALVEEKGPLEATRLVTQQNTETVGLYRGWMLKPSDYARLFEYLSRKGIRLINSPAAYRHCHYLPESYGIIERKTAKSVWLPVNEAPDMDEVMALLASFGKSPVIVKDYVKSQKHYWREACFIPDASDRSLASKIVARFIELQDGELNGGLVFREYIELEPLGTHPKSGMPLTKEFRVFVLNGKPLIVFEYWDEGDYGATIPPLAHFTEEMEAVQSKFYTMDIAKRTNGEWIIMELGDGQVAGLPEQVDVELFYRRLAEGL